MKASSATSATPTPAPQRTDRSSDKPRPTPTRVDRSALTGPSSLPDPAFNAYRKDLADIALAGEVLASHYAEPVIRLVKSGALLRVRPSDDSEALRQLGKDETFQLLEDSVGWAWGFADSDHRVGYVRSDGLAPVS